MTTYGFDPDEYRRPLREDLRLPTPQFSLPTMAPKTGALGKSWATGVADSDIYRHLTLEETVEADREKALYKQKIEDLGFWDMMGHAVQETWTLEPLFQDYHPAYWKREPGFVLSADDYEKLVQGVPPIAHEDILQAKSYAHAVTIREHALQRTQEAQELAEKFGGGAMFGAYALMGILDPVNVALMISGGGVYKAAANAAKYSRLARFFRTGVLAGGEAATVVGIRAAQDPLQDESHVLFATALAGTLAGGGGALARSGDDVMKAANGAALDEAADAGRVVTQRAYGELEPYNPDTHAYVRNLWPELEPLYRFEPDKAAAGKSPQDWADLKWGRVTFMGDRDKQLHGFVFESKEGNQAFIVKADRTVEFVDYNFRVAGKIDENGNVHLNMESWEFTEGFLRKDFEFSGPKNPRVIEQGIKETMEEFREVYGDVYGIWARTQDAATTGPLAGKLHQKSFDFPEEIVPDEPAAAMGDLGAQLDVDGNVVLPMESEMSTHALVARYIQETEPDLKGSLFDNPKFIEEHPRYGPLLELVRHRIFTKAGGRLSRDLMDVDSLEAIEALLQREGMGRAALIDIDNKTFASLVDEVQEEINAAQRALADEVQVREQAAIEARRQELAENPAEWKGHLVSDKEAAARIAPEPEVEINVAGHKVQRSEVEHDYPLGIVSKVNDDGTLRVEFPNRPAKNMRPDEIDPVTESILNREFMNEPLRMKPSKAIPKTWDMAGKPKNLSPAKGGALRERRKIYVVQCSDGKTVGPGGTALAKDLYKGEVFTNARKIAENDGDEWLIFSGKHGLVDPETPLAHYDQRYPKGAEERIDIVHRLRAELDKRYGYEDVDIVWLASDTYSKDFFSSLRGGWMPRGAPLQHIRTLRDDKLRSAIDWPLRPGLHKRMGMESSGHGPMRRYLNEAANDIDRSLDQVASGMARSEVKAPTKPPEKLRTVRVMPFEDELMATKTPKELELDIAYNIRGYFAEDVEAVLFPQLDRYELDYNHPFVGNLGRALNEIEKYLKETLHGKTMEQLGRDNMYPTRSTGKARTPDLSFEYYGDPDLRMAEKIYNILYKHLQEKPAARNKISEATSTADFNVSNISKILGNALFDFGDDLRKGIDHKRYLVDPEDMRLYQKEAAEHAKAMAAPNIYSEYTGTGPGGQSFTLYADPVTPGDWRGPKSYTLEVGDIAYSLRSNTKKGAEEEIKEILGDIAYRHKSEEIESYYKNMADRDALRNDVLDKRAAELQIRLDAHAEDLRVTHEALNINIDENTRLRTFEIREQLRRAMDEYDAMAKAEPVPVRDQSVWEKTYTITPHGKKIAITKGPSKGPKRKVVSLYVDPITGKRHNSKKDILRWVDADGNRYRIKNDAPAAVRKQLTDVHENIKSMKVSAELKGDGPIRGKAELNELVRIHNEEIAGNKQQLSMLRAIKKKVASATARISKLKGRKATPEEIHNEVLGREATYNLAELADDIKNLETINRRAQNNLRRYFDELRVHKIWDDIDAERQQKDLVELGRPGRADQPPSPRDRVDPVTGERYPEDTFFNPVDRGRYTFDMETGDEYFIGNAVTGRMWKPKDLIYKHAEIMRETRASQARTKNAGTDGFDTRAFDDTPIDRAESDDPGLHNFNDTGYGGKLFKTVTDTFFNGIRTRITNQKGEGMGVMRWLGKTVLGGPGGTDMMDEGAWKGAFGHRGDVERTVTTDFILGRQGIEDARNIEVNKRLAFFNDLQPLLQTWRKFHKKGILSWWTNSSQDEFGSLVGRLVIDKTEKLLAEQPEGIRSVLVEARDIVRRHYQEELAWLKRHGGEGWKDITFDDYYHPRFWDRSSIAFHRMKDGMNIPEKELVRVLKNAILERQKLPDEVAETIAKVFMDNIGSNTFSKLEGFLHSRSTAKDMARMLEQNFGYSPKEAENIAAMFQKGEKQARHQMHRLEMDVHKATTVTTRGGETLTVKMSDFMDHNIFTGARKYARHTTSKIMVNQLIHDFNLKNGTPGKFKNLDQIKDAIIQHLKKLGKSEGAIKRAEEHIDILWKIARDEPFSESTNNSLMSQLVRSMVYGIGHGWTFGISAIPEYVSAHFTHGIQGLMERMPVLREMAGGKVKMSTEQVKELAAASGLGMTERLIPRLDLFERMAEEGSGLAQDKQAFWKRMILGLNRITSEGSGLAMMTQASDHLALKTGMVRYGNMMIRGEMPNKVRLAQLGLTETEWERIAHQVRKQYKVQRSKTGVDQYQYDFSEWKDQGAVDLFNQAMINDVRAVVQRSSRADLPEKMFKGGGYMEMGRLLLQYRGFGMSSIPNYLVRNLRASDARSLAIASASMTGGALAYMTGTIIAHQDTPEGRERLKERMTPAAIAKGAFLRSAGGALSDFGNAASSALLGVDMYGNKTQTGISRAVTDNVRALSWLDDGYGILQSLIQTQIFESRDFAQHDYNRIRRFMGIMRHPFIAPFTRDLGTSLPRR